jgi:hypothetical protein
MILVHGISMSGYVPLEGVVGLSHFYFNRASGECVYKFNYLFGAETRETSGFDVMLRVVSFAVVNRFSEIVRSLIVRDLYPLFGYHRAGVVFPKRLLDIFEAIMALKDYDKMAYIFPRSGSDFHHSYSSYEYGQLVYTTAWSEYLSVDFMNSSTKTAPLFFVQMLGRFGMVLPSFRCDELRYILG